MDTVFRFIYFRVGNRPLAEDLTADTFLRALKRIGSFTWQGRDLGAWLVTIARNLVADHFKSGRYRLEVTTGEVLDADQADRGPEGSPEAAVVDHITNVALLDAVKQLNPEQQECIVLRFLHGFSVAETAHAMGKNEGAIKALQYRAVRALHRLLPGGLPAVTDAWHRADAASMNIGITPPVTANCRIRYTIRPADQQSSGSAGGSEGRASGEHTGLPSTARRPLAELLDETARGRRHHRRRRGRRRARRSGAPGRPRRSGHCGARARSGVSRQPSGPAHGQDRA